MQNKIIALLIGLLGAAAIFGGLYMFINPDYSLTSEQASWPKTTGYVTETTQKMGTDNYEFSAQYFVDNTPYQLTGNCGFPLKKVSVRYDPKAPEHSAYTLEAGAVPIYFAFIGGGVAMLVAAFRRWKTTPAIQH